MLCAMSQETWEPPLNRPVLPGEARSDYERYLNSEELLALQKGPDEWVHRDELLFQVVHQSSELWLKLAWNDTGAAAVLVARRLPHIPAAVQRPGRLRLALPEVAPGAALSDQRAGATACNAAEASAAARSPECTAPSM